VVRDSWATKLEKQVIFASSALFLLVGFWLHGSSQNLLAPVASLEALSYYAMYGATAVVGILALPFTWAASSKRLGNRSVEILAAKNWAGGFRAFWVSSLGTVGFFALIATFFFAQPSQATFGERSYLPSLLLLAFTTVVCSLAILLGRLFPVWISGPIVLLAPYALTVWTVQVQSQQPWASNLLLTYSIIPQFSVENDINWLPIVSASFMYLALAITILAFIRISSKSGNRLLAGALAILCAATAFASFANVKASPLIDRNFREVECSIGAVRVCSWPEITVAYPEQNKKIESMILVSQQLGLARIEQAGIFNDSVGGSTLKLKPIYSEDTNVLAKTLAGEMIIDDSCPLPLDPSGGFITPIQAEIALTILLGGQPLEIAPEIEFASEDPKLETRRLSKRESLEYFGLENQANVRAIFAKWISQPQGVCAG
jgi:hypothetical protein